MVYTSTVTQYSVNTCDVCMCVRVYLRVGGSVCLLICQQES